jgi:predicted TIM-barrel fold metal-dependent hydrolase
MSGTAAAEPILEPELPIVDPHHHLWWRDASMVAYFDNPDNLMGVALAPAFRQNLRYMFEELLADLTSGHNVRATVYMEVMSMYRPDGPEALRSVGEIEFANGVAAVAASGAVTDIKACAGIVGGVDLRLGAGVDEVLEAHMRAGGGRYRGVRAHHITFDPNSEVLGAYGGQPGVMADPKFREGLSRLAPLGLTYDAWQLDGQLPELVDLARAFPETRMIVNHVGGVVGVGPYRGKAEARFAAWRENIQALAALPNVAMKLGGLGMRLGDFPSSYTDGPFPSEMLAEEWRPHIEACIEAFGAGRCMFESNFPVDAGVGAYAVVWNAFKRIAKGCSADEKAALFAGTAANWYGLKL